MRENLIYIYCKREDAKTRKRKELFFSCLLRGFVTLCLCVYNKPVLRTTKLKGLSLPTMDNFSLFYINLTPPENLTLFNLNSTGRASAPSESGFFLKFFKFLNFLNVFKDFKDIKDFKEKLPLLLLPFFCSCNAVVDSVHEFPEASAELGRTEIYFRFADDTIKTEDYKTIDGNMEFASVISRAEDETRYAVRYTMEITDKAGKVIRLDSVTNAFNPENISFCVNLPLDADYRAVAWVEHVDAAAGNKDMFFRVKDLDRVEPTDFGYTQISTDRKKAFTGLLPFSTDKKKAAVDSDGTQIIRDTMDLICPIAKFKVITTGVTDYYAATKKWAVYGKLIFEEGVPLYYNARRRSIMSDSEPFSATALVSAYSGDECTLAFDHVFAIDEETTVAVRVEVYNEDNELITRSPPIEVPLIRNRQTIVKDRFLRVDGNGGGGVWIDDRFEGEIVIEL